MPFFQKNVDDTLIGPVQWRFAIVLSVLLIAGGIALTPFANIPWMPVPGYMTAFGAAMVITNIMLTMLLFGRGATEKDGVLISLGTAYFFVAAIFVPLMAAFPDGLVAGSIIGTRVSAVWLWSFWHAGFGLFILRFAWMASKTRQRSLSVWREIAMTVAIVIVLALLSTVGLPYLPSLLPDGHTFFTGSAQLIPWTILAIDVWAAIKLLQIRKQTPEQLWLTVGMVAACFDVWLTFHGTNRFAMGWYVAKLGSLFTSMAVLISLFSDLSLLYRRVFQTNVVLASLAHQDGLTNLANRRRFDEILAAEWGRARRYKQPLSLLMVDVDYFKKYNDRFGHLGGDDCLRQVSKILSECVNRPGDVAARYGGEEFALILPHTAAEGAIALGERINRDLAKLAIPHPDLDNGFVSVSIGAATIVPGQQLLPEQVVSAADAALYLAKSQGRNCVRHAAAMTGADAGLMPA